MAQTEKEESALTEALMKMRSRLRDENERILLELQDDAAKRIQQDITEKLTIITKQITEQKQEILPLILQYLHQRIYHLAHSQNDKFANLHEIIGNLSDKFEIPPVLVPYDQEITRIAKEFLQILFAAIKQHEMALFNETSNPYFTEKEEEIERLGQENWSSCMEMAKEEWSEMGSKRLAIEESYKDLFEHEENTMIKYIHDQLDLAYDSMIIKLKTDIQDIISTSLVSLERDHLALLAQGEKELQRMNELADLIDESGDVSSPPRPFSFPNLTTSD
jgi:hypothetical protein